MTFDEITQELDLKPTNLRQWIYEEYIVPEMGRNGHGVKTDFTDKDFQCIRTLKHLVSCGLNRRVASNFIYSPGWYPSKDFVISGQL